MSANPVELPPILRDNVVIRCLVGSTVHGLQVGNQDDRDEMGVFIPPRRYVLGLGMPEAFGLASMEHYVARTQPEGHRSGPGDLDLTLYSLKKYLTLACRGNPTVLLLLFSAPLQATNIGRELQLLAPSIVSQLAGPRFLGYLSAQKARLLGERGGKHTNRPELVEAYGFDTKYAGHVMRLGWQGIELMQTGKLTLPMPEPYRSEIVGVRTGQMKFEQTLRVIQLIEEDLVKAVAETTLPPEPNFDKVENWMSSAYRRQWGWLANYQYEGNL